MGEPDTPGTAPGDAREDADGAWTVVLAASNQAEKLAQEGQQAAFSISGDGTLRRVELDDPHAALIWHVDAGWRSRLPADDARRAIVELYLPICSATSHSPITVGHLGQSLD